MKWSLTTQRFNTNRDTHTHTHTHTKQCKQKTRHMVRSYKRLGALTKNKQVCLNRHRGGFLDSSRCPKKGGILISSVRLENIFPSTRIVGTFVTTIWRDV